MWELRNILLGNLLSLYLYSPLKTALFPHFSYKVLGVLPRLVWSQRSCSASLFSQLWEYLRASRKWESISLGLSGSVGIKGHAVAEAVAEAPKGVARALLYIVRASPSFLLHSSFKTFYHTFHQGQGVRLMRTRGANRVPHSINVPKVSSGKKEHIERRRERICMAQYHHKVNADIAQIRPQSSDLYEDRLTGTVQG